VQKYYVYLWRNLVNGKCYIGKGSGTRRFRHLNLSVATLIARAIRKYGEINFECVLLATDMEDRTALWLEKEMIKTLRTKVPGGYNLTDGGEGESGRVFSAEARARMSASHTGKILTPEHCAKLSASKRGKVMAPETKLKLSLAKKGKKKPEGFGDSMREIALNRSPETIERMRQAALRRHARQRATSGVSEQAQEGQPESQAAGAGTK
jgi:group I intron endonuclease